MDEKGSSLAGETLAKRRRKLEEFAQRHLGRKGSIRLSPATTDRAVAQKWLRGSGGALDGVVAKRLDVPYRSGNRTGMQKIKRMRTADCVVGGFRYGTGSKTIGSLLLGLYDEQGRLDHVGFCSSLSAAERKKLTPELEKLVKPPGFTGRAPGGPSRWSTKRSGEWEPLAPKLVVESWPVEKVIPYENNPRSNDSAVAKLAIGFRTFGWQGSPIVVDDKGVILAGHTRLRAAIEVGWTHVPVSVARNLTATQARAFRIADNRIGEEAEWATDTLVAEIAALNDAGFALETLGFGTELPYLLGETPVVDFKEYDETAAETVAYVVCPACNHKFPK